MCVFVVVVVVFFESGKKMLYEQQFAVQRVRHMQDYNTVCLNSQSREAWMVELLSAGCVNTTKSDYICYQKIGPSNLTRNKEISFVWLYVLSLSLS